MKDRRFHYVDAARGIAVLLVIYGHTFRESMRAAYAWCDFSYALVYRFHVSLLFLLSGFGYALTLEKNKTQTEWRYFGKKEKTQREIAKLYGISRSYVSRIEKRALGKLRKKYEEIENASGKRK